MTSPTPGDPVLDCAHLARQTFDDRDLQMELLELFVTQAQAMMATLHHPAALATPAARGHAADLLHTLCGSARAVGFWPVAASAEGWERVLRQPADEAATVTDRARLASLAREVAQAGEAAAAFRAMPAP